MAASAKNRAPAWLEDLAKAPLSSYPADTIAVNLLESEQMIVDANGKVETHYRYVYKILRPEGRDKFGTVVIPFDSETKVKSINAWTIAADGEVYELGPKDTMETGFSPDALYNDARQKILQLPAVDPGSVIGYEYVQEGRPYIHEENWWFQRSIPVRQAEFSIQIPVGWKIDSYWVNYASAKPQTFDHGDYKWSLANVPALPQAQTFMPDFNSLTGRLAIEYYQPANPDDPVTWQSLGDWYAKLTKGSGAATPAIQQEVAQLTAGATTTLDKIRALANFMQTQIRYVAIEVGIGGFQPHPAGLVFQNRYGDCKDMATLFNAMLSQIGVKSYYVLLDAERGVVLQNVPTLHMDHAILAIQLPKDVPTDTLYGVVDDPKLGRLLFFDATDKYCPFGYIPGYLQNSDALVVTPAGGELVKLPLLPPPTNRLLRIGRFTLATNGTLSAQTQEIRWGAPAEDARWSFLDAAPKDRGKVIENFLGNFLTNFQLTNAGLSNLDKPASNLMESYNFVAPGYAKQSGDLLLLHPCVLGEKELTFDPEKSRSYPVEFSATTLDSDQFSITLPAGYVAEQLPRPVLISDDFLDYKSETKLAGNVIEYTRIYELKAVDVAVRDLPQLKKDFAAISADERAFAVLRLAQPASASAGNAKKQP